MGNVRDPGAGSEEGVLEWVAVALVGVVSEAAAWEEVVWVEVESAGADRLVVVVVPRVVEAVRLVAGAGAEPAAELRGDPEVVRE